MNSDNKILLVLDLDETLIHSEKQPLYNKHDFKVYSYYVYLHPGLKEFLSEMSKIYSLAVWSAGADIYVDRVVKNTVTLWSEF
jgi:RNA polymerase II subunit A small phosphatase-like protein